ncbi:hypothetical protein [uncultured Corynebacterium sp.]|uniref:hypothetical protein n=1 Tax=uncultured Corynebacterium sp. TaxID=159447 RepID=UPI0035A606B8
MPLWPLSLLLTVASLGALGACLYAAISRGCAWPRPLTCPPRRAAGTGVVLVAAGSR